jgi:hypothetical protein
VGPGTSESEPAFDTSATIVALGSGYDNDQLSPYDAGLQLQAQYIDDFNATRIGEGNFTLTTIRTCMLTGGILLYPFQISSGSLKLQGDYKGDKLVTPM